MTTSDFNLVLEALEHAARVDVGWVGVPGSGYQGRQTKCSTCGKFTPYNDPKAKHERACKLKKAIKLIKDELESE